jgi:CBS domain-containing protein
MLGDVAAPTLRADRKELHMKVRDAMTETVFTVTPEVPLKTVARRMLEYGVSGMPVVDDGVVVGVVSETDILFKERTAPDRNGLVDWLIHYGEDPPLAKLEARTAGEAMTTPAVTIGPQRSVSDAATLMLDLGIDRLPVVDAGQLVGIITRTNLVRAFARTDREIAEEIRDAGLLRRLWVDPAHVQVTVADGNVVLAGTVDTPKSVAALVAFAERTPGVVSVESRLT